MNIKLNIKNIVRKSRRGLLTVLSCCIMLSGCSKNKNDMEIVWKDAGQESDTISEDVNTEIINDIENKDDTLAAKADSNLNEQAEKAKIYVYICGAVQNPGVYETDFDSRLYNVVELAGGMTSDADTEYVNLARTVNDGEQIIIFTKEETEGIEPQMYLAQQQAQTEIKQTQDKVNINTASKTQLTAITGIGDSRAQAIIAYRESTGAFRSIEDIKKVDGIKEGLFEKIKDSITVE